MNKKALKTLPNILTFSNMSMGFLVIYIMMQNPTLLSKQLCCCLILLGALIDMLDGQIARRFHAVSDFGKQLDSFADIITFAIAPLSIFFVESNGTFLLDFIICLSFLIAGAFRLARHNIQEHNVFFVGLPITAAGVILSLIYLIFSVFGNQVTSLEFLVLSRWFIIILSFLMVGKFPIKRIFSKKSK